MKDLCGDRCGDGPHSEEVWDRSLVDQKRPQSNERLFHGGRLPLPGDVGCKGRKGGSVHTGKPVLTNQQQTKPGGKISSVKTIDYISFSIGCRHFISVNSFLQFS